MSTKANTGLTVGDVSASLGVTQETVRRYIRERRLVAEKRKTVGLRKVWLVAREELDRFRNEQE